MTAGVGVGDDDFHQRVERFKVETEGATRADRQRASRFLRFGEGPDGCVRVSGLLPPLEGAEVKGVLDRLCDAAYRPPLGDSFSWENIELGEVPIGNHLLGNNNQRELRFNLSTLGFETDRRGLTAPFAVSPNGQWVIKRNGERWSTSPFQRNAFTFPGGGHAISGPTVGGGAYVAAFTGTLEDAFVIYDEADPGRIVYRRPRVNRRVVRRMEFRPGTSQLWVAVENTETFGAGFTVYPIDVAPAAMTAQIVAAPTNGAPVNLIPASTPHYDPVMPVSPLSPVSPVSPVTPVTPVSPVTTAPQSTALDYESRRTESVTFDPPGRLGFVGPCYPAGCRKRSRHDTSGGPQTPDETRPGYDQTRTSLSSR